MIARWKRHLIFLACLAVAWLPAPGQASLGQILNPSGVPLRESTPPDSFGRSTPSGTVFGFLKAAQEGDYTVAAQYLQLSPARREKEGEQTATKLKTVVDRAFVGRLKAISDQPDGVPQEGVRPDQQKIGTLSAGDTEADFTLVRVNDATAGKIWLVSSDTLSKVPELYDQSQLHQVESHLPSFVVRRTLVGMPLWQWLALLLAAVAAAVLSWLVLQALALPKAFWSRHEANADVAKHVISGPLWLVLGTWFHRIMVAFLGLPLLHRHYYQIVTNVVLVVGVNWLVWRLLERLMQRVRIRAVLAGRTGTGSLMLLGQRLLKAVLVVVTLFAALSAMGFNLTTALAGLGIGGLAVAFAAQKTLENLFGGVSILGDEVVRVGDVCRFGDKVGMVEDVSLRSTRVRMPDRIELSIPNGLLASMMVENLTRRDKILFNPVLKLRHETSPDQLRYILAQTRRMFYEHPKVETQGARVRLVAFDESAIRLELFCYVLTRDNDEFLAIQEDLLFRIMHILDSSGSGVASPSTTMIVKTDSSQNQEKDQAKEQEKTEAAHREVQQWRDAGKMPFPDFAPSDIAKFSDSLTYPEPNSAIFDQSQSKDGRKAG